MSAGNLGRGAGVPDAMTEDPIPPRRRGRLLAKFTGAALIAFLFSIVTLHFGLEAGLRPWVARLIAMVVAVHVAFFINGRFVFGGLTRERFLRLWGAYVANCAVGNLCNFAVFLAVQSSDWRVPGKPYIALVAGAATAWAINFLGARFLVFGIAGRRLAARARAALLSAPARRHRRSAPPAPAPAARGWSRR